MKDEFEGKTWQMFWACTVEGKPPGEVAAGRQAKSRVLRRLKSDYLNGGDGHDNLEGRGGDDDLQGGFGDDKYFFDSLVYSDGTQNGATLDLRSPGPQSVSPGTVLTQDWGVLERVYGSQVDDSVIGNGAANHLPGHGGDDALYGLEGNNILHGGAGDDALHGHAGTAATTSFRAARATT